MKKQEKELTIENALFVTGWILMAAATLCVIAYKLFIKDLGQLWLPCVFHEVTGLYCPGCGGTRAVKALLSGSLAGSLWYNPTVPLAVSAFILFMVTQALERCTGGRIKGIKYRNLYMWLLLAIMLVNCMVRNFLLIRYGIML